MCVYTHVCVHVRKLLIYTMSFIILVLYLINIIIIYILNIQIFIIHISLKKLWCVLCSTFKMNSPAGERQHLNIDSEALLHAISTPEPFSFL